MRAFTELAMRALTPLVLVLGSIFPVLAQAENPASFEKLNTPLLPNAYQITEKVISGGQPDGEEAFVELERLGVKTVISVDGAKPDLELAKKHHLRYVHLPHGYNGIPEERGKALAKAVRDLPGPIYIHCHHGKHRSPTAAAVACVLAGQLPAEKSEAVLKTAGTSPNYRGLYQSAIDAKPLATEQLDALEVSYPETADIPALAGAMVQLDHAYVHVKQLVEARQSTDARHPDITLPHESLLLREHFTEMARLEDLDEWPADFREMLTASEVAARKLEVATASEPIDWPTAQAAYLEITKHCATCHQEHRDVPLGEK